MSVFLILKLLRTFENFLFLKNEPKTQNRMQFEQIYRCINVLWDMKMILAPFGWWTTMSFARGDIWAEVDHVNMNRMPMDNSHHHQQIIPIILLRIVLIHSKHQKLTWELFKFLFWLKKKTKMRNEKRISVKISWKIELMAYICVLWVVVFRKLSFLPTGFS